MAFVAGTVDGMCPKSFHHAWRAIVEIGSECVFIVVGDVIEIKGINCSCLRWKVSRLLNSLLVRPHVPMLKVSIGIT